MKSDTSLAKLQDEIKVLRREKEIEAALEKVRSRSMAMQNSEELGDISFALVKQVQSLGVATWHCAFNIYDQDQNSSTEWGSNASGSYPRYKTPREGIFRKYYEIGQTGETFHIEVIGEDICTDHYAFLCTLPGVGEELVKLRDTGVSFPTSQIDHVAYFEYGYLLFITYEPCPKAYDIFKRFAKVFEQTYTRFLDLKKAEAQTREAQIEAALERVRANAMAMQKPAELVHVAVLLRKEMGLLGVEELETSSIYIHDETTGKTECWYSIQDRDNENNLISDHIKIDLNDTWVGQQMLSFYSAENNITSIVMQGANRIEWITYCAAKSEIFTVESFYGDVIPEPTYHLCKFNNGYMGAAAPGSISAESWNLLQRATSVFSLAYTRFSDLKKAEAQAREAQIEAALERVRARTMGMQKSEDLQEIIQVVFEQFIQLDIQIEHTGFILDYKVRNDMNIWLADEHAVYPQVTIPYFDSPHWNSLNDAKEKGLDFFTNHLDFEEKNKFYQDLFKFIPDLPEDVKEHYMTCPSLAISTVLMDNVGLYIENFSGTPYTDKENKILLRIGKVFQQTYTRFLDLQKAEAQAREAQIEAALERVRSRTMAMQKSEELAAVATILFQQVKALGVPQWACGFSIFEIDDKEFTWYQGGENDNVLPPNKIPLTEHPVFIQFNESRKRGDELYVYEKEGEVQKDHYRYMRTIPVLGEILQGMVDAGYDFPTFQIDHVANFSHGNLVFITYEHFPGMHDTFKRFAKVFEQTYTRFLDLQKAEAQAREAQIEAALEKVRSRSLAMHQSDELQEVINTVFDRLVELEIETGSASIMLHSEGFNDVEHWTQTNEKTYSSSVLVPYFEKSIASIDITNSMNCGSDLLSRYYTKDEKNELWNYLFEYTDYKHIPENRKKFILEAESWIVSVANAKSASILISRYSNVSFSEKENVILKRFAKVFEQAYIRFLDLQKSEAQAREAQIETALEKVRSRSLAMHQSDELREIVTIVAQKLKELDFAIDGAAFIATIPEDSDHINFWIGDDQTQYSNSFKLPRYDAPTMTDIWEAMESRMEFISKTYSSEAKNGWFEYAFEYTELKNALPKEFMKWILEQEYLTQSFAMQKHSMVGIHFHHQRELTENEIDILKRFSRVFEQSYVRFLDLQKAEAQAREAEVELALERIRAQTMAMHSSTDLKEVITLTYSQIDKLGFPIDACVISTKPVNPRDFNLWIAVPGQTYPREILIPYFDHPVFNNYIDAKDKSQKFFTETLTKVEKDTFYKYCFKHSVLGELMSEERKKVVLVAPGWIKSMVLSKSASLMAINFQEHSYTDNQNAVLTRFCQVFDQAYTRFLDLQKAEAQAREAQIESALEKVRSHSLAMYKSVELQEVINTVYDRLVELGVKMDSVNFDIFRGTGRDFDCWISAPNGKYSTSIYFPAIEFGPSKALMDARESGDDFVAYQCTGKENRRWFDFAFEHTDLRNIPKERKEQIRKNEYWTTSIALGKYSAIQLNTYSRESFSEGENDILKRFAKVFEQAYTRFLDLQKAEAQARETTKQASIARVRGEIASMRTAEDLKRITPLLWRELLALDVPFFRCGLMIVNEEENRVQFYLSTPDGKPLAALDLPIDGFDITKKGVAHWRLQKVYTLHWDQSQFMAFTKSLIDHGQIKEPEIYQDGKEPPESLTLQFVPFPQGMLYVGSAEALSTSQIDLVQDLADAFSVAYARYEDFNKLEEAKKNVDATLLELKATQSQLIQSEKMASLGELTAGIAHEIQNPLNFVNNFSELNEELIEELRDELKKGNLEEVKILLEDLLQNEEKIKHHGKRAESIVSSMLQHSRISSGQMEPTDLNSLCDEYLRLAYHGIRAKDKSFTADYKMEFDQSLSKLNVIPQDIGRVLLNLINNAFYAVASRQSSSDKEDLLKPTESSKGAYAPIVLVSTKRLDGLVEIKVKDNGSGIPDEIKEKVFQPFFTTKPTGQGTGLGLSLVYDIIKAHLGTISLESTINEGTEFTIQLPNV